MDVENGRSIARRAAHSELAVLEGAGHFWWHFDPINTARRVVDFMERHEPRQ